MIRWRLHAAGGKAAARTACRGRAPARVEARLVAPVHRRDDLGPLLLPIARDPAGSVGVPELHRQRPVEVEAEVGRTGGVVAGDVPPPWFGSVPGVLEAVVVEVEVADIALGPGAARAPGRARSRRRVNARIRSCIATFSGSAGNCSRQFAERGIKSGEILRPVGAIQRADARVALLWPRSLSDLASRAPRTRNSARFESTEPTSFCVAFPGSSRVANLTWRGYKSDSLLRERLGWI
jgi:hypothetical protein